uniref:HCO3_cotransp domain-containing protein n=1 Tax=Globodera pallida TaxID=36090 RepID=A0A183BNK6_GLOPA
MIGLMNSTEYYLFVFFVSVFFVFGQTETKFGLMEVASPSGKKNICVNVQQYKGADVLPEGAAARIKNPKIAYALVVLPLFVLGMPHALFDTFDFELILALPMPAVAGTIFSLVSGTFSKLWKGELKF